MRNFGGRKLSVGFSAVFVLSALVLSVFPQNMFRKMNDFDGDGKADFAVTRNEGGYKVWYIWQSLDGFRAFQWGLSSDLNAPGDYDGDGKTDMAVFRGENFAPRIPYFWIWNSGSNNFTQIPFDNIFRVNGTAQQDYNGDGKTDPAVVIGNILEPPGSGDTSVYGKYSGTDGTVQFGIPPYSFPVRAGDMTGDGRADRVYVSYNPEPNVVNITNIANGVSNSLEFGRDGDRYVAADFDGDNLGDLAVFRSSTGDWWWIRSSNGAVQVANWGTNGDFPVPADYDGDGKTDLAIWRPGSGQSYFWVYGSQNGVIVVPWGISTDRAVEP